ncbi:hypothetical protein [Brucepastera parasyntrophica]|nr:hypothetical protein [Brucepastera parasyntrophica]
MKKIFARIFLVAFIVMFITAFLFDAQAKKLKGDAISGYYRRQ